MVYVAGSRDDAIGETLKAIENAEKMKDAENRMSTLVGTSSATATAEPVSFPSLGTFSVFFYLPISSFNNTSGN